MLWPLATKQKCQNASRAWHAESDVKSFYRNILPHVNAELEAARQAMKAQKTDLAFSFLERAHVLGQESTILHVRVHWEMLVWGIHQRYPKEVMGQVLRTIGAATMTALGWVPHGNTGGANVSPFRAMDISDDLACLIAAAKQNR